MEKNIKIDVSAIISPLFIQIFEIKAAVFTILEIQKKEMSSEKKELYKGLYLKNLKQEFNYFAKQYPDLIPEWNEIGFADKVSKPVYNVSFGSTKESRARFKEDQFIELFIPIPKQESVF